MSEIAVAQGQRECVRCETPKPLSAFSGHQHTCKDCRNRLVKAARDGRRMCDVHLVMASHQCASEAGRAFGAECECGHYMAGMACQPCLLAARLGCLTCWREKRHKCTVRFLEPAGVAP